MNALVICTIRALRHVVLFAYKYYYNRCTAVIITDDKPISPNRRNQSTRQYIDFDSPPKSVDSSSASPTIAMYNLYPNTEDVESEDSSDDDEAKHQIDMEHTHSMPVPLRLRRAEIEKYLTKYDSILELTRLRCDLFITIAFITCFGCLFSAIAIIGILELGLMRRRSAWALLVAFQRPLVQDDFNSAKTWTCLWKLLGYIAILTNAGLISFALGIFSNWAFIHKLWLFIGISLCFLSVHFIVSHYLQDYPKDIEVQIQRTKYINAKLIDKSADITNPATLL